MFGDGVAESWEIGGTTSICAKERAAHAKNALTENRHEQVTALAWLFLIIFPPTTG